MRLLLDSWPVLEWIKNRSPVAETFQRILDEAADGEVQLEISRMNYGEILYSIAKDFSPDEAAFHVQAIRDLPFIIHSVNDDLLDEAVALKSVYPISYADCFCAAQAIRLGIPVVTGDSEFRLLETDGLLKLHWIGK